MKRFLIWPGTGRNFSSSKQAWERMIRGGFMSFRPVIFAAMLGLMALGFNTLGVFQASALDEVTYEALLEKDKLSLGEQIQYLVKVQFGMGTMVPNITPPSFNEFTVVNEYQSIQTQGSGPDQFQVLKKIWLLQPNEAGHLSIAAAIVAYQDPTTNLLKTGKTQIKFIDVARDAKASASSENQASVAERASPTGKQQALFAGAVVGVLALLVLLARMFAGRKNKPGRQSLEDTALAALNRAIGHAEQENLDAYYAVLHRAFLDYLLSKFGIDGNMLATAALLGRMRELGFGPVVLQGLEAFLKTADRAKFGGYTPLEDEMIVLHQVVRQFIEAGRKVKGTVSRAAKKNKSDGDDD
jgi:hypothetical protein